jgi:hypothetical protein
MVSRTFKCVGLLAAMLALASVSDPGRAQQREARLLTGPMSERPIILASCTAAELALCKAAVTNQCGADKGLCCPWGHSMRSEVRVAEMTLSGSRRPG